MALTHQLNKAIQSGIPGLSVAIADKTGLIWTGVSGTADITTATPVKESDLFGIGSITKTFVAVVILQLMEEGRLNLQQTAVDILGLDVAGKIPSGNLATLAQLLNHTGGIPSWEDDPTWIKEGRGEKLNVNKRWQREETLPYIFETSPINKPGEQYAYANTNHTLLGLVIEKITGNDLVDEIKQRILQPLGLNNIYLEGFQDLPQSRLAKRYHYASPDFIRNAGVAPEFVSVASITSHAPALIDVSPSNLSVEWAAGGMVATARDLALYAAAFQAGTLLKPESMAFVHEWFPVNDRTQIGHGVFKTNTKKGHRLIGHMGAVLGYTGSMQWSDEHNIAIVVLANVGTMHAGQGLPSAASLALDDDFLEAAFAYVAQYRKSSVLKQLSRNAPCLWINPSLGEASPSTQTAELSMADINEAEARLHRFAPLLQTLFPELTSSKGMIESELLNVPTLREHLISGPPETSIQGELWIKADHNLPVAGSIKARGGIYEVLHFVESLALEKRLLNSDSDDYTLLAKPEARALFEQYTLSVGSTGNLGLSIGLISAALGFKACVHMSVEAKQWKKDRLRNNGVTVVEHSNDYSNAVAAGRSAAEHDPYAYFVDDENSKHLFLGYSVAALRLKNQLREQAVLVDKEHPLFVYIPCGVGGAPGGITFGLKQVFGEAVHCFFAEPTQAPCMLLGMATDFKNDLSVYDVGLQINTEADGLAVGQASELVGSIMKPLLSGIFTVEDNQLFRGLYQLNRCEGMNIEPSAAAGFSGPRLLSGSKEGQAYLKQHGLLGHLAKANHIVWTTGGCFVPEEEYEVFFARGKAASNR